MSGAVAGLIGSLQRTTAYPPSFTGGFTGGYLTGVTYNQSVSVSNFTSASVTTGSIPTGMTFTYLANSYVNISGTPTTDGTYTFTITAINNPGGGVTQSSNTLSSTMTVTTQTNKRCTSGQISIACCTSTSSCGPYGAGATCSPASGSFDPDNC
jgi:hypothetical protein